MPLIINDTVAEYGRPESAVPPPTIGAMGFLPVLIVKHYNEKCDYIL
ncbi:MAG: hypothetical protein XE10_0723 [Methanoculleus marisnigri]|jgi:hypothetical protein|uniref:Uncharacterized protein n=1 Tax=Methanoculleus marisnigri TaxID=2198 RepID=A0A124FSQ3_9EURY|nr:MAG: hypothetical protein XD82_0576 [Methanoculleus marisnigri]KUL02346.1 MAG: hypothetical protein XE10_0723 [Methanoculleus marisnigri]